MAFDMIEAMTLIAREKNIEFDAVVATLEESLLVAANKKYAQVDNISFHFDKKNNELYMIAIKRVVDKVEDPELEIVLPDAIEIDKSAQLGDELEIYLDYEAEFGRNAIASAKQILVQKIRDVEHERIYDEFIDKVGNLVSGVVQQIDKGTVIVNLGRAEGVMPPREQLPREKFRQGDRIRALILDVQKTPRGAQITLSRVSNDFLRGLFAIEVPEIFERVIEIRSIAREPGERAKIAVYSSDDRIDPVGACVGIKGVRVQSIVRELSNERIDIVPFSTNPDMFVTRSLAPAKVLHIDTFEQDQKMTVIVEDEKLSLAIGRNGQNARLASKLTGWKINILSESEYNEVKRRDAEMLAPISRIEGIGTKLQERLSEVGIGSVQRLAQSSIELLVKIEGVGPKTAETLIEKASVLAKEIEDEQVAKDKERKASMLTSDAKLTESDIFQDDSELEAEEDEQTEADAPINEEKIDKDESGDTGDQSTSEKTE